MQLLRKLGFPISLIYAMVVYLRNYLYDLGLLPSKSFRTKTICVGNLSVGGTGKTPMIEFFLSKVNEQNKIAVLSRGYGRKSKGYLLARPGIGVEDLGDEPFQIYKKFPDALIAVDADRQHGISTLVETFRPSIILLDDAFQHRKVRCDQYVLLTAHSKLYVDDWYLPSGNLRDSKREAKRANVIVVTKCPPQLSVEEQQIIRRKLNPGPNQQVVFSFLEYETWLKGSMGKMDLAELKNKKVTLVTGIADPKQLVGFLSAQGIVFEHLAYPDHHFFTQKEIDLFNNREIVLTTEKDYVRLEGKGENFYYIGVRHQFMNRGEEVLLNLLGDSPIP
ncbi:MULTISPECIES: tetraacyldisaccharide 4'-kinase [unclassified Arenibacter]|uniref:tetraacyldisaccharide 4'-kinase n=1 Tax=unclassified Arenibacter TaxID=2615047 RepID=UPI000E34759F|nr:MULTISPECIES: tetraacyldisaccharide 4'-kinase [unclassified Arenibacter]MCM4164166.1 tetraacyldisaccharide 4'-kinase [Arenibacter sp. A80]RFT56246.1 tetraacyldisaccharide 4'-kinase [Arenibacter sp. P308M17]